MVLVKCASCFELVYEKSPLGCPRCGNPKFRRMSKAEQAQFSFVFQSAQQSVQLTGGTLPDFQALYDPEVLSGLEADTTPPTRN